MNSNSFDNNLMKTRIRFILILLVYFLSDYHVGSYAQVFKAKKITLNDSNLIFVEQGTFKMGDHKGEPDEHPQKKIKLSAYYIGKYEVTNAEYAAFLNEKGNQPEGNTLWINLNGNWRNLNCRIYEKDSQFLVEKGYEEYPVNFVSWFGANAFCKWKGGRLPTEAEWEYAAKGGKYSKGKLLKEIERKLEDYAWFSINSLEHCHQKGKKLPNILGLYDIYGNLWEWCSDYYGSAYYRQKRGKNPKGPTNGDYRIIRGGSWTNSKEMMRISNRNALNPNTSRINIGFRIVYDKN